MKKSIYLFFLCSIFFLCGVIFLNKTGRGQAKNFMRENREALEVYIGGVYERGVLLKRMMLNQYQQSEYEKGLSLAGKVLSICAYLDAYGDSLPLAGEDSGMASLASYMIGKYSVDKNVKQNTGSPYGETYFEEEKEEEEEEEKEPELSEEEKAKADNLKKIEKLKSTLNREYLIKNFYIKDSATSIDPKVFQVKKLLEKDVTMKKRKKPQILIYHTHGGSESFVDSEPGKKSDSVIGVGTYLAKLLEKQYGYQVIHDKTEFDKIDGKIDRSKAYTVALEKIEKTLEENPSIEVVIDLHRDGVGNKVQRTTTINGKRTAQLMLFNGLSRNSAGDIAYLKNDNLQANLAFSLQLKLAAMEKYPTFTKPIYLRDYRYNLHVKEKALLVELGNENNTLQEALNAMEPFAEILNQVLSG